jgi:hypothetical protein
VLYPASRAGLPDWGRSKDPKKKSQRAKRVKEKESNKRFKAFMQSCTNSLHRFPNCCSVEKGLQPSTVRQYSEKLSQFLTFVGCTRARPCWSSNANFLESCLPASAGQMLEKFGSNCHDPDLAGFD